MGDAFYLDPQNLKQTSGKVRQIGTRVDAAFAELQRTLDDMGEAWGNDEIGESFGKNYTPQEKKVHEALQGLVKTLGEFADGISNTSKEFQSLDGENADQISKADADLRHQLDNPPPE